MLSSKLASLASKDPLEARPNVNKYLQETSRLQGASVHISRVYLSAWCFLCSSWDKQHQTDIDTVHLLHSVEQKYTLLEGTNQVYLLCSEGQKYTLLEGTNQVYLLCSEGHKYTLLEGVNQV